MENKWLLVDLDYERLMQIEEGTYTVKMFNLDAAEASQAEYDREAEIDALNDLLNQQDIVTNVTGNLQELGL